MAAAEVAAADAEAADTSSSSSASLRSSSSSSSSPSSSSSSSSSSSLPPAPSPSPSCPPPLLLRTPSPRPVLPAALWAPLPLPPEPLPPPPTGTGVLNCSISALASKMVNDPLPTISERAASQWIRLRSVASRSPRREMYLPRSLKASFGLIISSREPPPRPSSDPQRIEVSAGDRVISMPSRSPDADGGAAPAADAPAAEDVVTAAVAAVEEAAPALPAPVMWVESAPATSNMSRSATPKSRCMAASHLIVRPCCSPLAFATCQSRFTASPSVRRSCSC